MVLVATAAAILFAVVLAAVAFWQMRSMAPELRSIEVPAQPSIGDRETAVPIELRLDLSTVQLMVFPAPAGEDLRIEAAFDPEHYSLQQQELQSTDRSGPSVLEIRFEPLTPSLAFMRMKLGEELPKLEVHVPRDQPLILKGEMKSSFAAIEAGGLTLEVFDLKVDGGAATVSFLEPLTAPMESFVLQGDKGSVEVTGLGNGSPAEVRIEHRLGEIDLDFRGPWRNDSTIDLQVQLGGGSLWLPRDVIARGLSEGSQGIVIAPPEGSPGLPELSISLQESAGRLIVVQ